MGKVESLEEHKVARGPHWRGTCVCLHCRHEQLVVAPLGRFNQLECPSCGLHRMVPKYNFERSEEDRYVCIYCESQHYVLHRDGATCAGCGNHNPWSEILNG